MSPLLKISLLLNFLLKEITMISSTSVSSSRKSISDFKYYTNKKVEPSGISLSLYNCCKCQKCGAICLVDNEPIYDAEFKNPGENTFTFLEVVSDNMKENGLTKLKTIPGPSTKIDSVICCESCQEN